MRSYSVMDICLAVKGALLQGDGQMMVRTITTDSRKIEEGSLFIPLVGERFDGHDYIASALKDGAAGCFTSKLPFDTMEGKFYILVEDTLLALKALASWYRGEFDLPMVQITGSAGKTTTKEMVASVLSQKFSTLKTEANFNNAIGTPQTLLRLDDTHEAAVIETGMNHFDEIRYLGDMVRPDVAIITNVGDAHVENLGGTRLGVLQAKSEIFDNLKSDGLAILNGDDALLRELRPNFRTVLCGKGENCHVRVSEIVERGIEGMDCTITTEKESYAVHIPSPGAFMIYPASMAVAVGEYLGLTVEEIVRGIAAYTSVGSRMRVVRKGDRLMIDDCYNANPQAMEQALETLAKTDVPRRMAVLGDMGELGDLTAQAHRRVGEVTARLGIDTVVAIGEKSRAIAEGNPKALWFATLEEALSAIVEQFTDGTAVLVKASHAMEFTKIVKKLEEV
ncbi:MAG: UDP-N-acetylmuramoyl-tripeptide--D-alanyl-D-alanine ligase [Oscillospiraceae bacterium]|nr:UDP-N-acetylmuramoyl-tripeptide--D-alanyl-D-alanine ligase [Oscillospiraceae bacterium]